jgi:hypothetical protein
MLNLVRHAWADWRRSPGKLRELLAVAAVFGAWVAFWYWRLATHAHVYACDNVVMGADGHEIIEGLSTEIIGYDAFKRPLFSVLAGLPVLLMTKGLGVDGETAALVSFALWAGIAVTLTYILMRRHFADLPQALLASTGFALSFCTVTIFSIPETYGVTIAALVFLLLLILEADRAGMGARPSLAAWLGVIAGLCAFVYPPLMATLLVWLVLNLQRHGVKPLVVPAIVAGACALAVYYAGLMAVFGADSFGEQGRYIDRFGSLAALTRWETYAAVLSVIYAMGLVSPEDGVLPLYGLEQWSGLANRPVAIAALIAVLVLYVAIAVHVKRRRRAEPQALALASLLVLLTLFFTFFNAREIMLYAVLPVLLVWLLAAWALGHGRRSVVLLGACVILFALTNLSPLGSAHDCAVATPTGAETDTRR